MIFWHVGMSLLIFRYVFRDPEVDVRFLAAGALLPDVIDKPLGTILLADRLGSGRVYAHTLLFPIALMGVVVLATRRGTRRRRAGMALAIGALLHLLLDGMWTSTRTFLWPAFGWRFPPGPPDYWSGLWGRIADSPLVLAQEAVGLVYLVSLARKTLRDPAGRRALLTRGRLLA